MRRDTHLGAIGIALLASAVAGCRGETAPPEPVGDGITAPPVRAPRLSLPPDRPLVTEALGKEAWRTLAVSPARDRVVIATAEHVFSLALPARNEVWRRALPGPVNFIAWSRDGAEVALLGRTDEADERLIVLGAVAGEVRSERVLPGLSSPPQPGDRGGIQPPAWPTGLMPAMGGEAGWWITNAYGVHLVRADATTLSEVKPAPADGARIVASQDGSSLWRAGSKTLEEVGGAGRVELGCHAQTFVVDRGLDRAVTTCWESQRPPELHVVELSTGRLLGVIESGPELAVVGLVARDALVVIAPGASQAGWIELGADGVRSRLVAQASGWGAIDFSPSGRLAVGVGGGAIEVLDVARGEVVCDHDVLGRHGVVIAAGFADEETLWTLSYRRDVFNALQVAVAAVFDRCLLGPARALGIGKTTNLVPRWAAGRPGFLLNALHGGGDYGLVLAPIADGATPEVLAPRATPQFAVFDGGRALSAVAHDFAAVWRADSGPAVERARFGAIARLAVCGARVLVYRYNLGWSVHTPDGARELTRFDVSQPEAVACAGDELFVADRRRLVVVDLGRDDPPDARATESLALERAPGVLAPSPDGRVVLMPGGGTGWRVWRRGPDTP